MLLAKFKLFVRMVLKRAPDDSSKIKIKDVHGNVVEGELLLSTSPIRIQPYPAKIKKYAVVNIDYLLEELSEIIEETKNQALVPELNDGGYTFDNLYLDTIKEFAKYVHILPASQNWHHHQPGGLLYHSLDVGYRALRWANDNSVPRFCHIDEEVRRRPRWRYAAWVGGLLHDVGKIVTDINVFGEDGSIWDPEEQNLVDWAKSSGTKTMNWEHKVNRVHKHHEVVAAEMLVKILPERARHFIKTSPDDLMGELKAVLRGYETSKGFLANAIRTADVISTQEDVQKVWENDLEQRTAAIYEQCVKAMKALLPRWGVNEKSGCVFNLGGDIYLKYPDSLEDVRDKLTTAGLNIPQTAKGLLNVLADRGIIKKDSDDSDYSMLSLGKYTKSQIAEDANKEQPRTKLRVIRVTWPGYVFGGDVIPPAMTGYVKTSLSWDVRHYTESTLRQYKKEELDSILAPTSGPSEITTEKLPQTEGATVTEKKTKLKLKMMLPGDDEAKKSEANNENKTTSKKIKLQRSKPKEDEKPKAPTMSSTTSPLRIDMPSSVTNKTMADLVTNTKDVDSKSPDNKPTPAASNILSSNRQNIPHISWSKGIVGKFEVTLHEELTKRLVYEGMSLVSIKELESKNKESRNDIIAKLKRKKYLHESIENKPNVLIKRGEVFYVAVSEKIAANYGTSESHTEPENIKKEKMVNEQSFSEMTTKEEFTVSQIKPDDIKVDAPTTKAERKTKASDKQPLKQATVKSTKKVVNVVIDSEGDIQPLVPVSVPAVDAIKINLLSHYPYYIDEQCLIDNESYWLLDIKEIAPLIAAKSGVGVPVSAAQIKHYLGKMSHTTEITSINQCNKEFSVVIK